MDWDVIAPMITVSLLIITTGGVLVLRPLSKRIAELLELMIKERQGAPTVKPASSDVQRIRELLEGVDQRLTRLEERQDFTDSLLASSERDRLPAGRPRA